MADHPDHPVFTPATGQRLHWNELPDQLQRALEDRLGAGVVDATTQPGGFSPGLAARLTLADGRQVFVKAVSGSANPDSPGMQIFDVHPLARGVPDDRVTALVAVITGFFIWQSRQPSPPGLPTIRGFQRHQGLPSLEWLKRRTGWT